MKKKSLGTIHDRIHVKSKYLYASYRKSSYARKRVKMIGGGYRGSAREFRETVKSYWKKYGVKPRKYWYDLYCNGMDSYDPRFVPDSMWYYTLLPYFNNLIMRKPYADKCMYSKLFPDVRKPQTIVKNIAGYYYNGDGEKLISRQEAIQICKKEEHLVFKPSLSSGGGVGIVFYDREEHDPGYVEELFDKFGVGFVAQRLVKQHPDLERINKDSLNTIRVMSFHFNDEVHILSAQLRMGGKGSRVDNITAGGCACAIKEDGWLSDRAVTRKSVWTDRHENGLLFKDIRVPSYDRVLDTVKRLHTQLPYFNIVGWDFAVDQEGEPVLIEFNVVPEQNQIGGKQPTFGELSDDVFQEVFIDQKREDVFDR